MIYLDSIVNSVFNSMTYLIHSDNSQDLYIVDCGDVQPIINYVHKYELTLRDILYLGEYRPSLPCSEVYIVLCGKADTTSFRP